VAAERLNAAETRAVVNVPITSTAYGQALNPDGSFNADIAHTNNQWEMDEMDQQLKMASFCGMGLKVVQAASVTG